MISISMSGIHDATIKINGLLKPKQVDAFIGSIAAEISSKAKQLAPEDTKTMMQNIKYYKAGENHWVVVSDAVDENGRHYSIYNEYGTIRMPAGTPDMPLAVVSSNGKAAFRPFFRPAILEAKKKIPEIYNKVMK